MPKQASTQPSVDIDKTTFRGITQADAELNFAWAAALIDALVASGATHAVMSPGAQMAPLSLACRANDALHVTIIIDERSASFFALGLARATQRPTILICTSGSAVGHWYPAVMEASAGLVPLILLTADRAPENQDRCSAQAIDQIRVYGPHVRASHNLPLPDSSIDALSAMASRVYEQSLWPSPGPVHVNMPFRDPLIPKGRKKLPFALPPVIAQSIVRPQLEDINSVAETISGRPGAIVCGSIELDNDFSKAVQDLARAAACPVIADPLCGLRFGAVPNGPILARADSFLRAPTFADSYHPEWIINFGGPAISKTVLTWLQFSRATDYIVVDNTPRWADPVLRVTRLLRSNPASFCRGLTTRVQPGPEGWASAFSACERYIDALANEEVGDLLWEAPIVRRLIGAAPENSIVYSGNSMSVRDFDSFSGTTAKRLRLIANRGTNGIDGSLGTLLGIAASQSGTTMAMIGDMAFAHDVGSLQLADGHDVVVVVINNGGGGIFEYLPSAKIPEHKDFLSPPTIDIGMAARACGWHHWRADNLPGFEAALAEAMSTGGSRLIEAVIDRRASVRHHHAYWAAAEQLYERNQGTNLDEKDWAFSIGKID